MPVMTKSPKGDEIVILSREEYDRLIEAGEDRKDSQTARRAIEQIESGAEAVSAGKNPARLLAQEARPDPVQPCEGNRHRSRFSVRDRIWPKAGDTGNTQEDRPSTQHQGRRSHIVRAVPSAIRAS